MQSAGGHIRVFLLKMAPGYANRYANISMLEYEYAESVLVLYGYLWGLVFAITDAYPRTLLVL